MSCKILMGVVIAIALSLPANATITPALDSGSPTVAGSLFSWNYTITVDSTEGLSPSVNSGCSPATPCPDGSFFTLYDIAGLFAATPTGFWGSTYQATGFTPSTVSVGDSAAWRNVSFYYAGPVEAGPFTLGGFKVLTTSNQVGTISYAFSATSTDVITGGMNGTSGSGFVAGPAPTPEPACFTMIGTGLIGLGLRRKNLKRYS